MFKPAVRNTVKGVVVAYTLCKAIKTTNDIPGLSIFSDTSPLEKTLVGTFGGAVTGIVGGVVTLGALDQVDIVLDAFQNL